MIRSSLRVILALFYLVAGILHLFSPGGFLAITPHWVPFPEIVVAVTGVAEIAGAVGLMIPQTRKWAAIGLALYALCVWPANFNHAFNGIAFDGNTLSWWYHGPRLAFQPVLIWLAFWVGHITNWPFGKSR
ncbi:DoxX family protein [Sphingorhabdus sp.]|jgi:uncharacterized membrane protein|uniref:DoxX family protein n=1 Tax=Sphingorhabdus sp. TaxID=1902408 RepID=UPI002632229D|nr:DoxX family protein [Sphingorhabdus sp.]MDH4398428.1 DoxX family protein [Sphingorhabdus sp.]